MSPLLIFHITTASIAVLGGLAAMSLRKGSTGHRTGGIVFVIGMICMTLSAVPLGILKTQTLNALVAALTCYLVASGWVRPPQSPSANRNGERSPRPGGIGSRRAVVQIWV
jgi:uncharacterized membrane protein YfcA